MTEQQDTCSSFDELTDYWTKDASADDVARIEEHVFTCERCARVLAWTERLRDGIGALVQAGGFQAFVTDDVVKHADVVDLGTMKGNLGNQNYTLPADTDLSKYPSVSIWCARFGVNFGNARLGPA